ncbi:MAG TPA: 4-vinyl reductase [Candidatus Deferrimicrobium sp.]|nr:4-vinyl reductase [Candidatus Deferrimicrobium sp.]
MTRLYDLYVINRDGLCLLHQKFGSIEVDSDLVGGFFSAIQQFMRDVLPIGDAQSIKSLDRGDFKLLIEHQKETDIFGIVISEKEDVEVRRKLIEIIAEFDRRYKNKLINFNGEVGEFQEFKNFILSKFPSQLIIPKHIPEIIDANLIYRIINGELNSVELGGINYGITNQQRMILRHINGQRMIEEISEIIQIPSEKVIEFISLLVWHNLLRLFIQPVVHDTDIFKTKDINLFFADSLEKQIVESTFGEKGLEFLKLNKGGLTIRDLAELSGIDLNTAKKMAAYFLVSDYIEKVGAEKAPSLVDLKNTPIAIYSYALKMAKGEDMGDLLKTFFNAGMNAATDFCQKTDLIYESEGMWFGNMTDVIIEVIKFFHKFIDHTFSGKMLNIIIRDCFECHNFRFYEPLCYFTTGLINGVFNFCKSKQMVEQSILLKVEEVECKALGANACKWAISFEKS